MKRCNEPANMDWSGIEDSVMGLIRAQLLVGKELTQLVVGAGNAAANALRNVKLPDLPGCKSCCDIPEACWMPVFLGEAECKLKPGDQGKICFIVTNQDFVSHRYAVQATGKDAGLISISDPQFELGPKERKCVTATLTAPSRDGSPAKSDSCCKDLEAVVWVRGCRDHYVRWSVDLAHKSQPCCYEIEVDDSADYVHHWYDHFYVTRPCFGSLAHPEQG